MDYLSVSPISCHIMNHDSGSLIFLEFEHETSPISYGVPLVLTPGNRSESTEHNDLSIVLFYFEEAQSIFDPTTLFEPGRPTVICVRSSVEKLGTAELLEFILGH